MKGYFGVGIYHPKTKTNMGTLWRASYLFGASFIFTIGRRYKGQCSDTLKTERHIPCYNYIDWEDFKNHIPKGCQPVCIELDKESTPLKKSSHPKQAVYILGAEDYGIPKEKMVGYQKVYIETKRPQSMNVAMAGSLVMYDRFMKLTPDTNSGEEGRV